MSQVPDFDLGLDQPPSRYIVGIDLGTTNCAVAFVDTHSSDRSVRPFSIDQLVDWSTLERRDTLPSFHYQLTDQERASLGPGSGPLFGQTKSTAAVTPVNPSEKTIPSATQSDFPSPNLKQAVSDTISLSIVGTWARDRGMQMPGRQIASAKSWLCHSGIDRTAQQLPWQGDEDVEKLSPVQASSCYLEHIRRIWDQRHPRAPLCDQDVVITLPASFDEVARELTIEAAKLAGLPKIYLIEEPQAAFYAWLSRHGHDWQKTISPGQSILVCDIGGGTTDFTLIRVRSNTSEAPLAAEASLHRVAVGQHLILGGDNLDLALAKVTEELIVHHQPASAGSSPSSADGSPDLATEQAPSSVSMASSGRESRKPVRLNARQFDALRMNCRVAKEILLGSDAPAQYTVTLPATGSRLLGALHSATLDQDLVRSVLLDGFFAVVDLRDKPQRQAVGLQEFGLPYAADPVITRHLAEFLWEHRWDGRENPEREVMTDIAAAKPDWILFNGGVLEAKQIRDVLLRQLQLWFAGCDASIPADWSIGVLKGNRLDLAVAIGAAYYGLVRRGEGVRIDANLARSYYLSVSEDPPRAICLVPGNARPGDRFRLDAQPFDLAIGQPVQFPLWVSSLQLVDAPGTVIEIDRERMKAMPPIRTVLEVPRRRQQANLPVLIEAELTEIGTLRLACVSVDGQHRWKLDFDVRAAVETDRTAHAGSAEQAGFVEQAIIDAARAAIKNVFDVGAQEDPKRLLDALTRAIGRKRADWPSSLLRHLWQALIDYEEGRKKSAGHEIRWINLLGYCLRPGFGLAADDWRVATTWRKVQGKLTFSSVAILSEAIILWRRIAGGFTSGQQQALYQEVSPRIRGILTGEGKSGASLPTTNEAIELLRLIGSLEWLSADEKSQIGASCLQALKKKRIAALHPAVAWTLGRLGSRVPVYGPLHTLISIDRAEAWVEELLRNQANFSELSLAVLQLARRTGDRYRDISETLRERVLYWMDERQVPLHYREAVREVHSLDVNEQSAIIGESLPLGIRVR